MDEMGYYKDYDRGFEGCISRFQYVDVFGRLISTVEDEDGEIYVSLSELKKSGFELYQAGTLPKAGQSKNFDKQLVNQFEMYMKMKAIEFQTVNKFSISQDRVNCIINNEISEHFTRSVETLPKAGQSKNFDKQLLNQFEMYMKMKAIEFQTVNKFSISQDRVNCIINNEISEHFTRSVGTLPKAGQSKNFDKQLLNQFEMYMKMKAIEFQTVNKFSISQDRVNCIINNEISEHFTRSVGTLPKAGQSKNFDKQLLNQFEMYMKMKAIEFQAVNKFSISQDRVNCIINNEISEHFTHSVKMNSTGLIQISSPVINYSDSSSLNRGRLTPDLNESKSYGNSRSNQQSRFSLSTGKTSNTPLGRSANQWNRDHSFISKKPNSSHLFKRSGESCQHYDSDEQFNPFNENRIPRNHSNFLRENNNIASFNMRSTNCAQKSNNAGDDDEKNLRRPFSLQNDNSGTQSEKEISSYVNKKIQNTNNGEHQIVDSLEQIPLLTIEAKHLSRVSLTRNIAQKDQDDTSIEQVLEFNESEKKLLNDIKPEHNLEKVNEIFVNRKDSSKPSANETKNDSDSIAIATAKRKVSSVENKVDASDFEETPPYVPEFLVDTAIDTPATDSAIITPDTTQRKSVIETPFYGTGIFQCAQVLNENTFVAFVFPNNFSSDLCELDLITAESQSQPNFNPNVGDFVAVLNDGDYVRGTVLNNIDGKYTSALVDFGTVLTTEKVRRLPDKFNNIPEFTCLCKCDPKVFKDIASNEGSSISVTTTIPGKLKLKIDAIDTEHEIDVARWNPFETSSLASDLNFNNDLVTQIPIVEKLTPEPIYTLQYPVQKLKDKDIVIIIAEQHGSLLLRTKDCNTVLKHVNQSIKDYRGKPFDNSLKIGQLAVASFNDDGFYRVVVASVENGRATIEYIDYGNSDTVPIDMLMNINENLAVMDNTLIKIHLKGFNGTKFSVRALRMLEDSSTRKEKFTVVHTGVENEYELISADQMSLSGRIKILDNPSPPKLQLVQTPSGVNSAGSSSQAPRESVVKLNDLPPSKFKIGLNTVMCMYAGDIKDGHVSFCLADNETSDLLCDIQNRIQKYITESFIAYKPKVDDICLAKFEGEWYRACVDEIDGNHVTVFYIDFGNSYTVTDSDICQIPTELAQIEPLVSLCLLKGVMANGTDTIEESFLLKIQNDLQEYAMYTINVLENVEGFLIITIPNLYNNWKKEDLLHKKT